jgi:hypothetical protein
VTALNNKSRTETEAVGAEESAKRYQLSTKLFAKNQVDLTLTERTLLVERIGALYGDVPLVYGRICDILEEREISVPIEDEDAGEDGIVVKNADLSNVAAKGAVIRPAESAKKG